MPLQKKDLEQILTYVKDHLSQWILEQSRGKISPSYEIDIRERIVRVEEELKHQRELIKKGFDLIEKRFELIEKNFESIDKRFELIERRFESIDKRFEQLTKRIDRFMIWSFGIMIAISSASISILKILLKP